MSSALFGTISGWPVVNVLSTGVLTIPMMLKRGFSQTFAGGIEAAASSGGEIMPPVMGVAASVLAVVFQARKQGIEAVGEKTPDMILNRQDWLNLLMIFLPILRTLFLLVTPTEAIDCGPLGPLFGVQRSGDGADCLAENLPFLFRIVQNSAGNAGSAGWWACALLAALFWLDPDFRRKPSQLIGGFADAGVLIATLYLMFLSVSVIDFCLNFTGLSGFVARDVPNLLRAFGTEVQGDGWCWPWRFWQDPCRSGGRRWPSPYRASHGTAEARPRLSAP